jgi:aspartyl protease family protein
MLWIAWILILGFMVLLFQEWLDKQRNPNNAPIYKLSSEGVREVVLQRSRYNQYIVSGTINGHPVTFLLDTGATQVALSEQLAQRLRLEKGLRGMAKTANGLVATYATELDTLTLGNIQLDNVRASITTGMSGDEVLLGMSALKHLEFYQRGDQLILKQQAFD